MKHFYRTFCLLIVIGVQGISNALNAQPREQIVKIIVAPDHDGWTYKVGENVRFNVGIYKYGNPLKDIEIRYEIKPEKMEPTKSETLTLKHSETMIKGGTLDQPGFLRCWVYATIDGKEYSNMATAAFEPEKIEPTVVYPEDFKEFWQKAIEENNKIPMEPKVTLLPDRCTDKVNVYQVQIQNYRQGSYIYGILCLPKGKGVFPAVLEVPGAGIRPYYGRVDLAEAGIISLQIGIHGIPVTMDPSVYDNLRNGALYNYWNINMDNRDEYYYKRVYLGCVRAVDYIFSLPEFDGSNLIVTGGSQGGALTIVTAGLDKRVKYLAALYPALSDLTGYLHDRAGGWPHMLNANHPENRTDANIKTLAYYDVVNFARQVTQPGFYAWGFNDTTCPPTSTYSAYNVINAPKELHIFQDTGHWTYPEEWEMKKNWVIGKLK